MYVAYYTSLQSCTVHYTYIHTITYIHIIVCICRITYIHIIVCICRITYIHHNVHICMYVVRRFTKDLKPSDISLAILTGRGVLTNLELNCDFISTALQLPPWIRVAKVICDRIRAHVPFTSLRNDPILIVSFVCCLLLLFTFQDSFSFSLSNVEYWYLGD